MLGDKYKKAAFFPFQSDNHCILTPNLSDEGTVVATEIIKGAQGKTSVMITIVFQITRLQKIALKAFYVIRIKCNVHI